jgi:tRNA A37 methylthiotransferase MiaB
MTRHLEGQTGRVVDVLVENGREGRTPQFAEVVLSRELPAGSIVQARITGRHGNRLTAELAQPPARAQALPTRSSSEVVAP